MESNRVLTSIDFGALKRVEQEGFRLTSHSALTTANFGSLEYVGGECKFQQNVALNNLDLRSLAQVTKTQKTKFNSKSNSKKVF